MSSIRRPRWRASATGQRSPKWLIAGHSKYLRAGRPHRHTGISRSRAHPLKPMTPVVEVKAKVISFRLSTFLRAGVATAVLGALGLGFAFGLAISTPSQSRSPHKVVTESSVASVPSSATTITPATAAPATPAAPLPKVVSCQPRSGPQMRPTTIEIGCDSGVAISNVTWSSWGSSTGSGSGTLTVKTCQPRCAPGRASSSAAFVVISDPVRGIFQHVLITPPTGVIASHSSSHPGSGWGSG